MGKSFDFSGWATKANLLCSDGRVIRPGAFSHCDGVKVPLVWNHQHNKPEEVLGHALLENRDEGVYAYCSFNDTKSAQHAKLLVQHGDINQLSIYANKLKHQGRDVIHGMIREVSLVLAGANPGAHIESVMMHGEESGEEGSIYTDEYITVEDPFESIEHADDAQKGEKEVAEETKNTKAEGEETLKDVFETLTEKQKKAVYAIIGEAIKDATSKNSESSGEVKHSDEDDDEDGDETIEDIFNTLTEKQKKAVYAIIGEALPNNDDDDDQEENNMKHNAFDAATNNTEILSADEMRSIIDDAKRGGSLKDAVLAHGIENVEYLQHGIENIDYLFPDARTINKTPEFIKRDTGWVGELMGKTTHTPFTRIKSIFADITEAEARAKGYLKGNLKTEELFTLLKRVTTPTTIYKKQKLDRDDVVDIVDFDVVAWLKSEMRMMLDEEIARAVLVGDGRSASSNDKINEQNLRPIWTDDDVFTVKHVVNAATLTTDEDKAKEFIRACKRSRKNYKGSGEPVMFMSEDMLTNILLIEDKNGRVIYDTIEKLRTVLRVSKIVTVPIMENLTRVVGANTHSLAAIYVNPKDYTIGADKGGAVNMFDDFDIDYNQMKYLIETRISGALTKPFSAVAIEFYVPTAA